MSDQTSFPEEGHTWRTGRSARALDEVDRRILAELTREGRISIRTLAERVHVSRANAYARVDRLLGDGVITGFTAQIDPERAGLGTSAYVLLTIQQNTWREVAAALEALPYVEHFALVGGDFDVLALVRAPNNASCGMWSSSASRMCPACAGPGPGWSSTSTRVASAGTDGRRPASPGRGPRRARRSGSEPAVVAQRDHRPTVTNPPHSVPHHRRPRGPGERPRSVVGLRAHHGVEMLFDHLVGEQPAREPVRVRREVEREMRLARSVRVEFDISRDQRGEPFERLLPELGRARGRGRSGRPARGRDRSPSARRCGSSRSVSRCPRRRAIRRACAAARRSRRSD